MQVHFGLENLPKFKNTVITIGTFDGVHAAHQKILNRLNALAVAVDGESVLITFHPHPKHVLQSNQSDLKLLSTPEEKIELLKHTGIKHLVVIPFTENFSKQSAEDYVEKFLVEKFHPKKIVVGFNHHFGNSRKGNVAMLLQAGERFGFEVIELEKQMEDEITISSTSIRNELQNGNVAEANKLLGHEYLLMGKVVEGKKLGRTIGFPTANIEPLMNEKLIPSDGVYVVQMLVGGELHRGMMNIGNRPTVDGMHKTIEVNVFDFDRNIYGEMVQIFFHERIRAEKKFGGLDELKQQLKLDKETAILFFEKSKAMNLRIEI